MNPFLNKDNWKKYKPQREKYLPISQGTRRRLKLAHSLIVSTALLLDISHLSTMSLVRIAYIVNLFPTHLVPYQSFFFLTIL